jgi:hypothetical protein
MKKADYKFHRDKKERIEQDSRQTTPTDGFFWGKFANRPIFIPKKKKKK